MRVVIFGSTSAMAHATALCMAREGAALCLVARNAELRAQQAQELRAAGAKAIFELDFDAARLDGLDALFDRALESLGTLDTVLLAHGDMPDQFAAERDTDKLVQTLQVNGTSTAILASRAAAHFEERGAGNLAVISSGAGEHGRRSTYLYGMSKSLVTTCFQGLRARLHPKVAVLTVFPCFVDTPMTAYLPPKLRFVTPEHAGARIYAAIRKRKDTLYIPRWWQLALIAARNVPEWLVKRSKSEERFAEKLREQGRPNR